MKALIYDISITFAAILLTILGVSFVVMVAAQPLVALGFAQALSAVVLLFLASIVWNVDFSTEKEY